MSIHILSLHFFLHCINIIIGAVYCAISSCITMDQISYYSVWNVLFDFVQEIIYHKRSRINWSLYLKYSKFRSNFCLSWYIDVFTTNSTTSITKTTREVERYGKIAHRKGFTGPLSYLELRSHRSLFVSLRIWWGKQCPLQLLHF